LSVPVVESSVVKRLHTFGRVVLKEYPRQVRSFLHAVQHCPAAVALVASVDVPEKSTLVANAQVCAETSSEESNDGPATKQITARSTAYFTI